MGEKLWTLKELADGLSITVRMVRYYIGQLNLETCGTRRRVLVKDKEASRLEKWLKRPREGKFQG